MIAQHDVLDPVESALYTLEPLVDALEAAVQLATQGAERPGDPECLRADQARSSAPFATIPVRA